jgi:hypothetical protein
VVIKDKSRANFNPTSAFYTTDDSMFFGDTKSYFRIEVGKKYNITLDKKNNLGKYELVVG